MAGPGIAVERGEIGQHLRPEGIQVEVANEFEEVRLLLHHDGLVPILKEMADAVMAAIEGAGVAREERAHTPGERPGAGADQEVRLIREQRPRVDGESALRDQADQAGDEVGPVPVVAEDGRPLDPPHHDVVEGVRSIQAGLARHRTWRLAQDD